MDITIRQAEKQDMKGVLALIKELALFEKAPEEVWIDEQDLIKDGFGEAPSFRVHIAEANGSIIGIALFFTGYSTWKGKLLFLDDLVVQENFRQKGVGRRLMTSVIDYAKSINAKIIKWQVLNWNQPAFKFYERYNPVQDPEWVDCKMFEQQIQEFES